MVAPLVAAAAREVAQGEAKKKTVQQAESIQRSHAQNQTLLRNAKALRQAGVTQAPLRPAANEQFAVANDNQELPQERVNRLRTTRAHMILAAQEGAQEQIEREEEQKPGLIWYMPAFTVAAFKDGLDFIFIGSLPVIGTIITLICSFLIFIFLMFAKKNGGFREMGFVIKRLLIILVGFLIEGFLFGVNFFPFEIATVAVIYFMDRNLSAKHLAFLQNIANTLGKKHL